DELYLLFDGVLAVEQDGEQVAENGPGAILGEMALLEGGRRTATLRALTRCRVAVVPGDRVDRTALAEVARPRPRGGTDTDAARHELRRPDPGGGPLLPQLRGLAGRRAPARGPQGG